MFKPAFDAFAATYARGEPTLVATRLIADLETPVSAFLKLSGEREGNCFLLESVEGGTTRGRYSMIGLDPDVVWRADNGRAEINRSATIDREAFEPCIEKPLESLRAFVRESAITQDASLPPMAAGVFGYLGYDMVREMERLPPAKADPIGVPDAILIRPTIIAVFDSVKDELCIVTPVRPRAGVSAQAAYDAAIERLENIVQILEGPLAHPGAADPMLLAEEPESNTPEPQFLQMVERAKEYVRAGDFFQVVLSQP